MNNVELIGRLTRDPDLRYTTGSEPTAVCRFSIAVNTGFGDRQRADYPSIVVWGKIAENCDKYLSKGSLVGITGRIQTGSYEKDGRKIYTTDIIASNVEFLSSSGNKQQSSDQNQPPEAAGNMPSGFNTLEDDDIPF